MPETIWQTPDADRVLAEQEVVALRGLNASTAAARLQKYGADRVVQRRHMSKLEDVPPCASMGVRYSGGQR